jgi:hypothetical protein
MVGAAGQRAQVVDGLGVDGGLRAALAELPTATGWPAQFQDDGRAVPDAAEFPDDLGDNHAVVAAEHQRLADGPGQVDPVHPGVEQPEDVQDVAEPVVGQFLLWIHPADVLAAQQARYPAAGTDGLGPDRGQDRDQLWPGMPAEVLDLLPVVGVQPRQSRMASTRPAVAAQVHQRPGQPLYWPARCATRSCTVQPAPLRSSTTWPSCSSRTARNSHLARSDYQQ